MVEPIRPEQVHRFKIDVIPPEVIQVFNELIAEHADEHLHARLLQTQVVQSVCKKMGISPKKFKPPWLEINSIYEAAGWKVDYDKPGFNESYTATFLFKPKQPIQ